MKKDKSLFMIVGVDVENSKKIYFLSHTSLTDIYTATYEQALSILTNKGFEPSKKYPGLFVLNYDYKKESDENSLYCAILDHLQKEGTVLKEDYNKLLKLNVMYNGNDTYSFIPVVDRQNRSLTLGSLIVSGSDEAMRKFCYRMQFKDCDSVPDSIRNMKYIDMVLGMKAGIVKHLWVWRNKWQPSNSKIYLEEN